MIQIDLAAVFLVVDGHLPDAVKKHFCRIRGETGKEHLLADILLILAEYGCQCWIADTYLSLHVGHEQTDIQGKIHAVQQFLLSGNNLIESLKLESHRTLLSAEAHPPEQSAQQHKTEPAQHCDGINRQFGSKYHPVHDVFRRFVYKAPVKTGKKHGHGVHHATVFGNASAQPERHLALLCRQYAVQLSCNGHRSRNLHLLPRVSLLLHHGCRGHVVLFRSSNELRHLAEHGRGRHEHRHTCIGRIQIIHRLKHIKHKSVGSSPYGKEHRLAGFHGFECRLRLLLGQRRRRAEG